MTSQPLSFAFIQDHPMPDLLASFQKHDIGHLRIVAGFWGVELESNEAQAAAQELAACILDASLVSEVTESLPDEARAALSALAKDGRIPWAEFTRRFGQVREMGAGKRDRERPQLLPASAAEALFYRALMARAFFNTEKGAQEFAYIPDDLLSLVRHEPVEVQQAEVPPAGDRTASLEPLGRPASPGEHGGEILAGDRLLDDATTLLAALRLGMAPPETAIPPHIVMEFLKAAGLIRRSTPQPEPVKKFLEMQRDEALKSLAEGWIESESFNELRLLPGILCEGEWTNQPLVTREFLSGLLEAIPDGKWWSLPAFIRGVKEKYPDYQRPAGDYDSWFIKRLSDGVYLRGFASWDNVDGALVSFFITGILHWLGLADLATAEDGRTITTFRLTSPVEKKDSGGKISVASNGTITVTRDASRAVRYQVARFGEWEPEKPDSYRYRITPGSLKRAREQGLKVEHLLTLLARHASAGIPPVLVKGLKSWEANGTEARVQSQVILRVTRPEILEELRKSKAARFLGESLGPAAVVIKEGAQARVLAALAEMGLLADDETANRTDAPKGN